MTVVLMMVMCNDDDQDGVENSRWERRYVYLKLMMMMKTMWC